MLNHYKFSQKNILFLVLTLTILFSPLKLFLIFLPAWVLIKPKIKDAALALPIIFAIGLGSGALIACLLDIINLRINLLSIATTSLILALILYIYSKRFGFKGFTLPKVNKKYLCGIYAITLITLASRVGSIFNSIAPILHDPISHAYWVKRIVEEGAINYFYSPGLHIWGAIFQETTGMSYAKSINIVTNMFSAFSVLLWGAVFIVISKSSKKGYWISFAVAISPMPLVLYFTAGKNALISAFALMPLVFLISVYNSEKYSRSGLVAASAALLVIGIFHYPVFAFSSVAYFLYISTEHMQNHRLKDIKKVVFLAIVPVIASSVTLGGFMMITRAEDPQLPKMSRAEATSLQSEFNQDSSATPITKSTYKQNVNDKKQLKTLNPIRTTKQTVIEFLNLIAQTSGKYSLVFVGAVIPTTIMLLVDMVNKRSKESTIIVTLLISTALICIAIPALGIVSLDIVQNSGLFLFLSFAMLGSYLVFKDSGRRVGYIFSLIGMSVVLVMAHNTYTTYQTKTRNGLNVNNSDLSAFEWIKHNTPSNSRFIGLSGSNPNRASIIYPIDGSAWLPVYTSSMPATPFQDTRFNSIESNINYIYFLKFTSGEPIAIQQAIDYYKKNNYAYIYVDGQSTHSTFNVDSLAAKNIARIVYKNGEVSILEFN